MKMDDRKNNSDQDFERGILLENKPEIKKPSMYNVILINDDYTPMEFVIDILQMFFNKKKRRGNSNYASCA